MIYAADFPVMNDLLGFLTANCCGGNPCMSGADSSTQGDGQDRQAWNPSTEGEHS